LLDGYVCDIIDEIKGGMMKYLSICSGIEAASVAWHSLGWQPLAFSEIEPFPREVLSKRYPNVPCHGDFTVLRDQEWIVDADVLVGGTPCQAFSIAGLRNSLADQRGNLSLEFVRLADAIDNFRLSAGKPPAIIVWENVPGVLSVSDNAFGCFLAALAGDDTPYVPPRGKWTNAGVVAGSKRTIAWIIKDAQYFGVAQRRRRVFVIASSRNGFDPAAVLLEFEGVRRDTPPRRGTGQEASSTSGASFVNGFQSSQSGVRLTNTHATLDANNGSRRHNGVIVEQPIAYSIMPMNSGKDYKARETDVSQPLMAAGPVGGNQGGDFVAQPLVYDTRNGLAPHGSMQGSPVVGALLAKEAEMPMVLSLQPTAYGFQPRIARNGRGDMGDVVGTLSAEAGTGDTAPCVAVAYPIQSPGRCDGQGSVGIGQPEDPMFTLSTMKDQHAVACEVADTLSVNANQTTGFHGDIAAVGMQVRRLTPTECERLQGFPDGYTAIPWKKKDASECPDGPRYKALGNSMAVPVMRWTGERINNQVNQSFSTP
jgi:DNA (cytosine-5)-methyltransferase 1